jgi:hypothetical protein
MVTYSLKQSTDGRWSVCRSGFTLFSGLRLGPAIRLAREVARDEHLRSSRTVYVEMPGTESSIRLAYFIRSTGLLEKAA